MEFSIIRMELLIIRSLLKKDFYDNYKGSACPHKIFSKEVGRIKTLIDEAMAKYRRDLTVDEIEGLYFAGDPTMSTSQKEAYRGLFAKLRAEQPISDDIASEILSKLFQKYLGKQIYNMAFDYTNGSETSLQPMRQMLDRYRDDFLPEMNVEWDDLEIDTLLEKNDLEARWHFNIPTVAFKCEGVNAGHLIVVGARPNTGKTSFHASMIAGPGGFAEQGAKCVVLCNEEGTHRVGARYLTACSGMTLKDIRVNPKKAQHAWQQLKENIKIKDATGQDMHWVESVCKTYEPDVLVLDMGDKFAQEQTHEGLKNCSIHARQIAI